MKTNRQSAFSLVELIVVAAVIAVIIGFAVPAANNLIKGSQLTQGSQTFADLFSFARQSAMSRSRPVEVRFYRYGDLDTPGEDANDKTTWKFHGYQLFEILENGAALPINKMQRLPKMVVMSSIDPSAAGGGGTTAKYSTLLNTNFRGDYKEAADDLTTHPLHAQRKIAIRRFSMPPFQPTAIASGLRPMLGRSHQPRPL